MVYDDDEEPRRPKKKRVKRAKDTDNSTLKIFLIVFGSLAGLFVVACCGAGTWMYFKVQSFAKQVAITNPADIQKLTAELTDITLPAEFVPQHGSSVFGMKMVNYQWCPGGNCVPRADGGGGMLNLTSFTMNAPNHPGQNASTFSMEQFSDANLKTQWKNFTKSEHEFTIRGKACKFVIIQGEQLEFAFDEAEMDGESAEASETVMTINEQGQLVEDDDDEPAAATPEAPAEPLGAGRRMVQVSGAFPGKQAEVHLEILLGPDQYDEAKILEMLKSIR